MNIFIIGIYGRMGKDLCQILKNLGHKIVGGVDKIKDEKKHIFCDFNIPQNLIKKIDIIVDFSSPDLITNELNFCVENNKKLAIFSTGHTELQNNQIEIASKKIPIFKTSNTSYGIALLNKILKENISYLKKYDISITEEHHKGKKDSPSGTAKTILNIFEAENLQVCCQSVRAGNIVGNHTILFAGNNEQIEFKHTAYSRSLFSFSAVKILNFLNNAKNNKLYTMEDLFL